MFDVRKRLYSLVPAIFAALLQHTIQESTHYVAARLLVIAWAPAIVTTLIGCALYLAHDRWLASVPLLNAGLWFSMAYFLVVDPLYFAVLSSFFGGGDVAALAGARLGGDCAVVQSAPGVQAAPRGQSGARTLLVAN